MAAADPFALINRSMGRAAAARGGYPPGAGAAGRRRKVLDPTNPKDIEYLRRMHPDFDEVMVSASIDYKTACHTDANFASKFRIPPVMEAQRSFREHTNSVDAVCWGPDAGTFVSASHDGTLKVWDAQRGVCTDTLTGHVAGVYHCAVGSNKRFVLSCGSGAEKNVLLWKWPTKQVQCELRGHARSVVHCSFAAEGTVASTVDQDGMVLVHDLERSLCTLRLAAHRGMAHASSFCLEDTNLLLTVGADGDMQLLDIREQHGPKSWHLPSTVANAVTRRVTLGLPAAHDGYAVHAAAFPDRTTIFSGGADCKLKRWDLRSLAPFNAKCAGQYLGHTAPVRSLAVTPDKRFLASGCEDGSLRVWPRDPLGDTRSALRELRAEAKKIEEEFDDDTKFGTPEQKRRLEENRKAQAPLREEETRLARDGYVSAARALNAHTGLVSAVAWQVDAGNTNAQILTSSWDQSIQLFSFGFNDFR